MSNQPNEVPITIDQINAVMAEARRVSGKDLNVFLGAMLFAYVHGCRINNISKEKMTTNFMAALDDEGHALN